MRIETLISHLERKYAHRVFEYRYLRELYRIKLSFTQYENNSRLALQLKSEIEGHRGSWEPFLMASTNLPEQPCETSELYIKNWSENEGVEGWLHTNKIIEREFTGEATSGFVTCRRYKVTL